MIAFDKDRRLDIIGKPLYGRISFFQKDTNQLDKIYIYDENDQLVLCENPVYTDINGFLEYDVILENKIYTVHQEKYIGDYDDPKTDIRSEMWVDDRTYYAGFDIPQGKQDTVVFGYESIADASPSLGMITVVGYHTNDDCGARTYVWDENSNDQVDNGQVFGSRLQSGGRWLLVNTLPYIPSEYYGVYEGHLENMSSLFGASYEYGTNNRIVSPKVIKMKRGDYNIQTNYSTGRTLLLEDEVDFGSAHTITCKDLQFIGAKNRNPIGNFHFNGSSVEVDSFIFYDLFQMLTSGAKTIHIYDKLNAQTNNKNASITCSNMTFVGHGSIDYPSNSYVVTFDNCRFIGESIFSLHGKIKLKNMPVTDKPFDTIYSAEIDTTNCSLDIENFLSSDTYVRVAKDMFNLTDIDLQGRTLAERMDIGTIVLGEGITYRNASIGYIAPHDNSNTFVNCSIRKASVDAATGTTFDSCEIGELLYTSYSQNDKEIILKNCSVQHFQLNENVKCSITAKNTTFYCDIGHDIEQAPAGVDWSNPFIGTLDFDECEVYGEIVIRGQSTFHNCHLHDSIWTQDYLEGNTNVIRASFISCVIDGRHYIQHYIAYRNNVRTYLTWIDNTFNYTEKNPIYPESWSDPLGEGTFTQDQCSTLYLDPYPAHHSWTYKGNKGPKVIPDYPTGQYTSIMNTASNHNEGFAKILEVQYVAPGHSIKDGGTHERMDSDDMYMNNLKVNLHFYREMYWTGSHETVHRPDPLGNAAVVRSFSTNKDYTFDGGYHWTCKPRKTTAFWENSSEAYFRIMFDIDSPNHDWGNMEEYGCLDIMPYNSVKYV